MLVLIRTEARSDEFAMCLALGATRARLVRGIVVEGALLSFTGAAATARFLTTLPGAADSPDLSFHLSIVFSLPSCALT